MIGHVLDLVVGVEHVGLGPGPRVEVAIEVEHVVRDRLFPGRQFTIGSEFGIQFAFDLGLFRQVLLKTLRFLNERLFKVHQQ